MPECHPKSRRRPSAPALSSAPDSSFTWSTNDRDREEAEADQRERDFGIERGAVEFDPNPNLIPERILARLERLKQQHLETWAHLATP